MNDTELYCKKNAQDLTENLIYNISLGCIGECIMSKQTRYYCGYNSSSPS